MSALEQVLDGLTREKLLLSSKLTTLTSANKDIPTRSSIEARLRQIDKEIRDLLSTSQE